VGAIQHELLAAGVDRATNVDVSRAYISAAREEAHRRGQADRISYLHGDFVDLAEDIAPADIVTLDRVICCYPDMKKLVGLSAARARKWYGLVYPRDTWWVKYGWALENLFFRVRRNPYRAYVHPTEAVDTLLGRFGFKQRSSQQTLFWQVVVYTR
jgi:magnesium-protoporphyrin O-methyltransferase